MMGTSKCPYNIPILFKIHARYPLNKDISSNCEE